MNIPTWLMVFISIIYGLWSYIEILGIIGYNDLIQRGFKPRYTRLSYTITVIWVLIGIGSLCYLIFG